MNKILIANRGEIASSYYKSMQRNEYKNCCSLFGNR